MDQKLMHDFRKKVNDHNLVLHIFRNHFGKNQWSIICSAMDWIEVSLDGIDLSTLSQNNDNQASIKMITFLSCVDIMWEGIQQLHRVLVDKKTIPFEKDNSIFHQHIPDNRFFKTIRACFAAHPVNLQDVFTDDKENERWYASWSGGSFSRKDFSVVLYSNDPQKDSRFLDVGFDEVYEFAKKRYGYLSKLSEQTDSIISAHNKSFQAIPLCKGSDTLTSIDCLIDENKKRLGSDYYDYELLKIRRVLQIAIHPSNKNTAAINAYRCALQKELEEIEDKLQRMELNELQNQVDDSMPMKIQYPFSKLSDAVWQSQDCMFHDWAVEKLKLFFDGIVDINSGMSQEEVYVLVCAGAYVMNQRGC